MKKIIIIVLISIGFQSCKLWADETEEVLKRPQTDIEIEVPPWNKEDPDDNPLTGF